jgi:hypothetical protein
MTNNTTQSFPLDPTAPPQATAASAPDVPAPPSTLKPPPSTAPSTPAPGESPRAFEAFCAYLELGPRRRYAAVARKLGVGLRTIKRWAAQFDWRTRIGDHAVRTAGLSAEIRAADTLETATREKSLRERQLFLAETITEVTERYFEQIEDMDFEHVRLPDACRALEFASRLLSQAQAADNTANPDSGLRDQLAALLDQVYRQPPKSTTP